MGVGGFIIYSPLSRVTSAKLDRQLERLGALQQLLLTRPPYTLTLTLTLTLTP